MNKTRLSPPTRRNRGCALAVILGLAALGQPHLSRAVTFDLAPTLVVGDTNNAYAAPSDQIIHREDAFTTLGLLGKLTLFRPRAAHSAAYAFGLTRYSTTTGADNISHTGSWMSTLAPSGRTSVVLTATASYATFAALYRLDPAVADTSSTAVGLAPTRVLTTGASELASYEPSGRDKLIQSLGVGYSHPVTAGAVMPNTLSLSLLGRGQHISGRSTYAVTAIAGDSFIDSSTGSGAYSDGQILTFQLLGGWTRELSATTTADLQAGAMAVYGVTAGSMAVGPSAVGSLSYKRKPWYATLSVAQQPSVNVYVGEALVSDTASARLSLPLNRRETLTVTGLAGYTYARRITPDAHFLQADRAFDLITLGASLAYHLERMPLFCALDYASTTLHGSLSGTSYFPSNDRRVISLSLGGFFAFGQGPVP